MGRRVAIFDDHPLYRAGLIAAFRDSEFFVHWDGGDITDFVTIAGKSHIVLLDWTLLPAPTDLIEELRHGHPETRVAAVSMSEAREHVTAALSAGVLAYLSEEIGAAELLTAMRHVSEGRQYLQPSLAARLLS